MTESQQDPPRERKQRRSPLGLAIQVGTLVFVGGLLGLLVQRLIQSSSGPHLVAAVRAQNKPTAPDFRHAVIWRHAETWSASLQPLAQRDQLRLRALRGHPVVLNFWASWCIPCGREAPRLNASAAAHRNTVAFLGIDVKDFTGEARRFLRHHHTNYVSVHASGPQPYENYGLTGLPETYYLDARGRILAHTVGEVSPRELEAGVARIEAAK
ncbi:MAG: TlpA family protein disulfide reductase [Actinomycetota bacterium]|nr:TlpA family protein disulfide reductase [Actinomycetota bacterium]